MKRYLAPVLSAVIVALIVSAFGFFYFLILRGIPGAGGIRYVFVAVAIAAICIIIAVLILRIKEIKRGEEDDIGKY